MARIPTGNFGQSSPQAHQTQLPQDRRGQIIGGILQGAGQQVGQYAEAVDKQQREAEVNAKKLELYNNELDKKEGQLKVDEVLTTEFSDKTAELKNQVANGVLSAEAANKQLREWSSERFTQLGTELPGHAMPDYKNYWDANVNKQSGSFFPLQLKATEQKDMVINNRALEIASRMNRAEGRQFLFDKISTSMISEPSKQQFLIDFEKGQDHKEISTGIEAAFAAGDINALKQVQESIYDKKYLNSKEAQSYSASISSKIMTLQQRAEIAENKRINEAGKVLNNYKSAVLTGMDLSSDLINNTAAAVKGTEYEAEFNFYNKLQKDFQAFSHKSTSEQLRIINEFKAHQKNSKSNDPEADNKILATYESIYADKLKVSKEDPNQGLRQAGIRVPELNPATISADPAGAAKTIAEIGAYQVAQRDKDPNAAIKPISPSVLPAAQVAFNNSSVDGKLAFIGNLITATKNTKGGQQVWQSTLKQLGGGDMSYVMAGVARINDFKTQIGGEDAQDVATAIIAGNQALKNKALVMPSDDLLKQNFNSYVGTSATGETATMTFDAYKSIYAYLSQRDNRIYKDSKDFDKRISELALGMATGGVYSQNVGTFKNWKVSKPYGMSDSKFAASIEGGYGHVSKATGIPVSELKNMRLARSNKTTEKGELLYDLLNERGNPLIVGGTPWRIAFNKVYK